MEKENAFKKSKYGGKDKYAGMPTQEKFEELQKDSQGELESKVEEIR
jgi:hypothetical protein